MAMFAGIPVPEQVQKSIDATKCEYRNVGRSGLRVSVPMLGFMSFGNDQWMNWLINEEKAAPLIKAAYDRGVNTWDIANMYSNGDCERLAAKVIKKYSIPRNKVNITTKCLAAVAEDPSVFTTPFLSRMSESKDYVNQVMLSRQAIFNSVNKSLERLETDYIDLLMIHRFDPYTPIEETMEALHDLVKMGKVRYIGASTMWTFQFVMMQSVAEQRGWSKFISMQNHYNLLYREEEREMNKYCAVTGVGLLPWAPLARGNLARPHSSLTESTRGEGEAAGFAFPSGHSETDKKIIARVEEVAHKRGWTMSQVALAWLNRRICTPVIGISSVERLDEALAARGKVLTDDEEVYLEELYQTRPVEGLYIDEQVLLTKQHAPWLVR